MGSDFLLNGCDRSDETLRRLAPGDAAGLEEGSVCEKKFFLSLRGR
jgi:hypothetical protein